MVAYWPGGEHPLMGTHNRLILIGSPTFPDAYLEIIAIHSGAPCARSAPARRWFDLDDQELQNQLAKRGPHLVHFVARTARVDEGVRALARAGLDRGEVLPASRPTPQGLLRYCVRAAVPPKRIVCALNWRSGWGRRRGVPCVDLEGCFSPPATGGVDLPVKGRSKQAASGNHLCRPNHATQPTLTPPPAPASRARR